MRRLKLLILGIWIFKDWHLWILDRFKKLPKGTYIFRLRNGMKFNFTAWEKYGDQGLGSMQEIFLEERYNKRYRLKEGDSVIDIGSGIGEYLVYAAKKGVSARGYDMNPDRHDDCLKNLALNDCNARVVLSEVKSLDSIGGG